MSIETEILKKQIPNIKKLIEYGFEKRIMIYTIPKIFLTTLSKLKLLLKKIMK